MPPSRGLERGHVLDRGRVDAGEIGRRAVHAEAALAELRDRRHAVDATHLRRHVLTEERERGRW